MSLGHSRGGRQPTPMKYIIMLMIVIVMFGVLTLVVVYPWAVEAFVLMSDELQQSMMIFAAVVVVVMIAAFVFCVLISNMRRRTGRRGSL